MNHSRQYTPSAEQLAIALGWFSVALGAAEVAAPHRLARLIGASDSERTAAALRGYGAREIATGVAILSQPHEPRWLWSRVAGDVVDLASLAAASRHEPEHRRRAAAAAAAVLGVTALDVYCATRLATASHTAGAETAGGPRHVEHTITVNRPIEQVYASCSEFQNSPRFSGVELVEAREHERIEWRSAEGSRVRHTGRVEFSRAPGARGTELRVVLHVEMPGGRLGSALAWLAGRDPDQQLREELRRFKQVLEAGEVAVSDGPSLRRPAQPAAQPEALGAGMGGQR